MEEKRYNDAILILTDVVREDPQRLDQAEDLLKEIRQIRSQYNNRYEDLITVLYEENDVGKALRIIEELESLDANPNEATRVAVNKARTSAAFVFNLNRFNDIMKEALAALDEERYSDAVELYLSGFDLHREDFDKQEYGNIIKDPIYSGVETVNSAAGRYLENAERVREISDRCTAAVTSEDLTNVRENMSQFSDILNELTSLHRRIYEAGRTFEEQNTIIEEQTERGKEEFFLSYTMRLTNGRQQVDHLEGISGAIRLQVERNTEDLYENFVSRLEQEFAEGRAAFEENANESASERFRTVIELAEIAAILDRSLQRLVVPEGPAGLKKADKRMITENIAPALHKQTYREASKKYLELLQMRVSYIEEQVEPPAELTELEELRSFILEIRSQTADIQRSWKRQVETIKSLRLEGIELDRAESVAVNLSNTIQTTQERFLQQEIDTVRRIASAEFDPLEELFRNFQTEVESSEGYIEGVPSEGEEDILVRYPDRALTILEETETDLEDLRVRVTEFRDELQNESPEIKESSPVADYTRRSRNLIEDIEVLLGRIPPLVARAEEMVFEAERYVNEGYLRYREAQSALNQRDFALAREKIADARDRFTTALSLQEDEELRNETDRLLQNLAAEINNTQNRLVVQEVRNLISRGKELYQQGQFNRSETLLLRARNRWNTTNAEENPEIEYWLRFVRAALSVETGRVIEETDPLYTEMQQLLNMARRNYLSGKEALEEGNKRDALEYFNRAEDTILQIRIPFPFNQEASVLSLKILQLKDPDNFNELFAQKINEAERKLEYDPQQGYIELKDLQQIKPDYPGLSNLIYQAEIALGIRVPPPDPADLRESEQLYSQALSIVQRNIRSQYPIALEQLNRAIELNPNNQQAINLKDRIQVEAGGGATVVLSSAAEQRYREAEEKFIEGNYFEALGIVERLLQDEQNKRYPPLLELKRRIESKI